MKSYNTGRKGSAKAYALAIQSDGKIVVAGYIDIGEFDCVFALVRYKYNP